ncbi:hypothetical protein IW262DRAFT_1263039, partial [Armillaria fumosa]
RKIQIWHHFGFKGPVKFRYGSKTFKCLMENHKVEMAGEAEDVAERITSMSHKEHCDCKCNVCQAD